MATPDKVVLVDGSALIFRAFFAIPANFSTAAGLHTNAVYGFATMFKKMFSGRKPSYGAVVFDAPGRTFREEKYPDYKAQRPEMPDELAEQLEWIDRLVVANHFPLLRKPGFEADDIIGTLTRQARAENMEVLIVSSDKDFAQLIDDHVRMVDTLRDITYDPELVRKKWGVPPHQMVDLLAMMGDSSDNVPGVPGVGQKGAAQLLEKYGSLDEVIAHASELKGRQQAAFTEHAHLARLSKELVTIDCNVPLDLTVRDLVVRPPEPAALNQVYKELEFYSLLDREQQSELAAAAGGAHQVAGSLEALALVLAALPRSQPVAIFPLHDAPSPIRGQLVGLALCATPGQATYVPVRGLGGLGAAGLEQMRALLADASRPKVLHDAKALMNLLGREGMELAGVVGDTMLASFLIDPTKLIPHPLGAVAKEYLERALQPFKGITGGGRAQRQPSEILPAELGPWAGDQADAVLQLWPILDRKIAEIDLQKHLHEVDLPLSVVLAQMERTGIQVDRADLDSLGKEFHTHLQEIEKRIYALAGHELNIGSPKQLGDVLFEELKLPVIKKNKTGYSTDSEVLERLKDKHPIAAEILEHRRLAKLINTYTDVLQREVDPRTHRIHATFQQTTGATGRLITTDPDLQRTPIKTEEGKRIRRAFITREGWQVLSADWSQIELRILAHFAADPALVEAFTKGLDIHRRTACELFGTTPEQVTPHQRNIAKTVNFATIYGQGATSLGQILEIPRAEAKQYIDHYFEAYAGVRRWLDATIAHAHELGYVTTLLGRRRYIPELASRNVMIRQAGERIAANTPIQGTGADICKLAMLKIHADLVARGMRARMLLQIHDELLFEAPAGEMAELKTLVKHHMEHAVPLAVPLVVDAGVGASWAEAH